MIYKWKPQTHFPVAAQVAGDILDDIRTQNDGRLVASLVVDEARPEEHPLHPVFEWDDDRAAELYRQQQAREMIRSVIVADMGPVPEIEMRAFVSVRQSGDTALSYTHINVVMRDEDLAEQVIERARRALEAWKQQYGTLRYVSQEFRALFALIEEVTA